MRPSRRSRTRTLAAFSRSPRSSFGSPTRLRFPFDSPLDLGAPREARGVGRDPPRRALAPCRKPFILCSLFLSPIRTRLRQHRVTHLAFAPGLRQAQQVGSPSSRFHDRRAGHHDHRRRAHGPLRRLLRRHAWHERPYRGLTARARGSANRPLPGEVHLRRGRVPQGPRQGSRHRAHGAGAPVRSRRLPRRRDPHGGPRG